MKNLMTTFVLAALCAGAHAQDSDSAPPLNDSDFGSNAGSYKKDGKYPDNFKVATDCGFWTLTVQQSDPSPGPDKGKCTGSGSSSAHVDSTGVKLTGKGDSKDCGAFASRVVDGYRILNGVFTPEDCCVGYVQGVFKNNIYGSVKLIEAGATGKAAGFCGIKTDFTNPVSIISELKKSGGTTHTGHVQTYQWKGEVQGIPYEFEVVVPKHSLPTSSKDDNDDGATGGAKETNNFFVKKVTRGEISVWTDGSGEVMATSSGENETVMLLLSGKTIPDCVYEEEEEEEEDTF